MHVNNPNALVRLGELFNRVAADAAVVQGTQSAAGLCSTGEGPRVLPLAEQVKGLPICEQMSLSSVFNYVRTHTTRKTENGDSWDRNPASGVHHILPGASGYPSIRHTKPPGPETTEDVSCTTVILQKRLLGSQFFLSCDCENRMIPTIH